MANSSILGGDHAPSIPRGTSVDALGPSDSSDSGSDVATDLGRSALSEPGSEGALPIDHAGTSDAAGTGERAAADGRDGDAGADILPDRIGIFPDDALASAISLDDAGSASVEDLAVGDDVDADLDRDGDSAERGA